MGRLNVITTTGFVRVRQRPRASSSRGLFLVGATGSASSSRRSRARTWASNKARCQTKPFARSRLVPRADFST